MGSPFAYRGNFHGAVSGTIYQITGSQTSSLVLKENPERAFFVMHNLSNADVYVSYGDRCSSAGLFSFVLRSGSGPYFEEPPVWAGNVTAVFGSLPTTGSLQVTELV